MNVHRGSLLGRCSWQNDSAGKTGSPPGSNLCLGRTGLQTGWLSPSVGAPAARLRSPIWSLPDAPRPAQTRCATRRTHTSSRACHTRLREPSYADGTPPRAACRSRLRPKLDRWQSHRQLWPLTRRPKARAASGRDGEGVGDCLRARAHDRSTSLHARRPLPHPLLHGRKGPTCSCDAACALPYAAYAASEMRAGPQGQGLPRRCPSARDAYPRAYAACAAPPQSPSLSPLVASHLAAALADDDVARPARLVAVHLDAQPLGVGVAAVLGRAAALLVRALGDQPRGARRRQCGARGGRRERQRHGWPALARGARNTLCRDPQQATTRGGDVTRTSVLLSCTRPR